MLREVCAGGERNREGLARRAERVVALAGGGASEEVRGGVAGGGRGCGRRCVGARASGERAAARGGR